MISSLIVTYYTFHLFKNMCYRAKEGILTNYSSSTLGKDNKMVAIRAVQCNCLSVTDARYYFIFCKCTDFIHFNLSCYIYYRILISVQSALNICHSLILLNPIPIKMRHFPLLDFKDYLIFIKPNCCSRHCYKYFNHTQHSWKKRESHLWSFCILPKN
jgi:hypothetical protein